MKPSRSRSRARTLLHLPVKVWLVLIVLAGLTHPFLPEGRWVLVHLFTLGAVTNSIVVWGRHFAKRSSQPPLSLIALLNAGILVVIAGKMLGQWPVVLVGAVLVSAALLWHAAALIRLRAWWYALSTLCLPLGATMGVLIVSPWGAARHDDLLLAHEVINLLGFLGCAALGTLQRMFPAVWRTRAHGGWPRLVVGCMASGLLLGALGALGGLRPMAMVGVGLIALAWILQAIPWARDVLAVLRDPRDRVTYASASVAAAVCWLIGSLLVAVPRVLSPGFVISSLTIPLVIGFGAQLLLGMMSYLLPTTIGGGPSALRAGLREMDRGGMFRWALVNVGLLLWLLPLPSWARVGVSGLCCLGLAAVLPLIARAAKAQVSVLRGGEGPGVEDMPRGLRAQQVSLAVSVLAVVALVGSVLTTGNLGAGGSVAPADVEPTGETVTAEVTAQDMSYSPAEVAARPGDRLVLTFRNTDSQVHDLHLATGQDSGRVEPGAEVTLEVPVVPAEGIEGWCTIAGHRQMGMTFRVTTGAGTAPRPTAGAGGHQHGHGQAGMIADPSSDSPTVDPWLAPASAERTHRVTLRASEFQAEVAPGMRQEVWSFGKDPVAPTLRGHLGDRFEITFINDGSMSHSLDFHATSASPDAMTTQVPPGETFHYAFTATRAGIWLYHCSTHPMSQHISMGMHGAVIIDPPGLAPVDHEVVLVGSEIYADPADVIAEEPSAWRFNGYAAQYVSSAHPLRVKAGETVRFWVLAAGPNQGLSFHIVGAQFHRVFKEGRMLLDEEPGAAGGGSQALDLAAAQGGYVETRFEEPGTYTFVDHQMVHAERGMRGNVIVEATTPAEHPNS
ncbi:multicopper oxidase domain-containing protein [Corynebacterium uropygiale]|uniref:Multicopper oxidase domain-containing protein n=1 Tax=Corynebacterium uropygiale TaxID=1775911 RepID=A0A9X1QQX1_9CORY|nr:multicopper oxidase domain-containing protein [Corynebacterium uropygiale]MCF4007126.1 multicopper oxidase domain-containing protein [Corynebacterium uropygiale]